MNTRGFVLVEWLLASSIALVVAGVLFAAIAPIRDVVERTHHRVDQVLSSRAALDLLTGDLREAGAGPAIAPDGVRLAAVLPPVVLLRHLHADEPAQPAAAIRILQMPFRGAQARLAEHVDGGADWLPLDITARCATGPPACGFRNGDRAALITAAQATLVQIREVAHGGVRLVAPLAHAFPRGAALGRLTQTTYGVRDLGQGRLRLVRLTDGGAEHPLLEHVVGFAIETSDPDLLRPRRLSIRLRVEAATASLRGPAGALFVHAGTSGTPRRWLPDLELRSVVALRNGGA